MASDCATRHQRRTAPPNQGTKGSEPMDNPARAPDASKLIAMADNVVIRNGQYKRARRTPEESREYGRLNKSIHELAETAEKIRKAGKVSPP